MLKIVTITGADDTIVASDLIKLNNEFPFVEWGLLYSRKQQGNKRFPSAEFLEQIKQIPGLRLSLHLCGSIVKEVLHGDMNFFAKGEIPTWEMFNRVQLNTHGERHTYNSKGLVDLINIFPEKEFIFQGDNANKAILYSVLHEGVLNVSTLFDLSHGAGVLPADWPTPEDGVKCGYAGGLSSGNLPEEIPKIEDKAGEKETWIDVETNVRTTSEDFSLSLVDGFLHVASNYVKK